MEASQNLYHLSPHFTKYQPYLCPTDWNLLLFTLTDFKKSDTSLAQEIKGYFNKKTTKIGSHDSHTIQKCFVIAKIFLITDILNTCSKDLVFLSAFKEGNSALRSLLPEIGVHITQLQYPFLISSSKFLTDHIFLFQKIELPPTPLTFSENTNFHRKQLVIKNEKRNNCCTIQ